MKIFKDPAVATDQLLLLPPNVSDFVPEDALVRILSELIDQMDCDILRKPYKGGGAPAYDPVILFKVLVFGCSQGIRSSRRLCQALTYDLRFMYLARMSTPDFRTIARFRRSNEVAITRLFAQTVVVANELGLVLLDHASVDGTKLEANAAKRNYRRSAELDRDLERTEQQIAKLLQEMEETDNKEEEEHGDGSGDGIPEALRTLQARKKRYEQAKEDREQQQQKAVIMTDPQSRMMHHRGGGIRPSYNAQAVVDSGAQIILAAEVTQDEADARQLRPMLEQVSTTLGELPKRVSADGGYWSKSSFDYVDENSLDAYIAPSGTLEDNLAGWTYDVAQDVWSSPEGDEHVFSTTKIHDNRAYRLYRCKKTRRVKWVNDDAKRMSRMRKKVATTEGKAIYRRRQAIVEPVFGHIKGPYGLRKLGLRGLSGAKIEYLLACFTHNMGKLIRFRQATA